MDAGETVLVMGDMNARIGDRTVEILQNAGVTFAPVEGTTVILIEVSTCSVLLIILDGSVRPRPLRIQLSFAASLVASGRRTLGPLRRGSRIEAYASEMRTRSKMRIAAPPPQERVYLADCRTPQRKINLADDAPDYPCLQKLARHLRHLL